MLNSNEDLVYCLYEKQYIHYLACVMDIGF
jgi:hypothetical protein